MTSVICRMTYTWLVAPVHIYKPCACDWLLFWRFLTAMNVTWRCPCVSVCCVSYFHLEDDNWIFLKFPFTSALKYRLLPLSFDFFLFYFAIQLPALLSTLNTVNRMLQRVTRDEKTFPCWRTLYISCSKAVNELFIRSPFSSIAVYPSYGKSSMQSRQKGRYLCDCVCCLSVVKSRILLTIHFKRLLARADQLTGCDLGVSSNVYVSLLLC